MSEWPTLGMFEALVDQPFDVDVGGRSTLSLTLESSKSLGERPHRLDGTDVRESFSLLFRGPAEPVLPQAIYRFVSKGLGQLDIFIVPVGPDSDGMLYEAIYN